MAQTFYDIEFDIIAREIVMVAPLGNANCDFKTTTNPSVQNGGILQYSRCANVVYPMFGIGMEELMNGPISDVAYELNRWQAQAKLDGATIAKWTSKYLGSNNVQINTFIDYL